jgi:hypothetical protein
VKIGDQVTFLVDEKTGAEAAGGADLDDRFAEFLARLQAMPDVDGRTVLDNTLIFQSSDISDGDSHNHDDMPVVLAGGGAGFTMGRHLDYTGNWFGELFLSIAQAYGVPNVTTFGEHGMAPLTGLTV